MSLETGLAGKRALVTGGGTGIGRAIALELARQGAGVVIAGRRAQPETVAELAALRVPAHGLTVDVSQEAQVVGMVEDAAAYLGGLDLYVNVAAGAWHEPLTHLTTDAWMRTLSTNLSACVWGCREVARRFVAQGSGSILVIGSTATVSAQPRETAYRASKAALKAHVEVAAVELAPFGIRVNLLTPGATDTAFVPPSSAAQRERAMREVPLRREAQPDELAPAAAFLLSDQLAGYITGADLIVDGGLRLRPIFHGSDEELRDLSR